ncbi:hypothetical protein F4781DRAFT_443649 [Annulohypoxylon bovei var. microspora]|nr:hypothetical protein F4781DRAFT_443649 [Annulohypoxylon bovei var. microspora]
MAEGSSSYDKVDHPKDRFGDWEALSAREADPRRSEDDESQSDPEENDHRQSSVGTNGRLAEPDARRDLSVKTSGSLSQPRFSPNETLARIGDGSPNGDRDESTKKYQAAEPQGHPLSSTSGSATPSSVESPTRVSSPRSPLSPTDVSRPTVRFSDRGPPRAFAKRPILSRRSSANPMPTAEWGVLFDERGYATLRCSQFLKGLAKHIIDDLAPSSNSLVITPEKLSVFYSRYKVDPEVYLFVEIFNSRARDVHDRIADFFTDLDCQYHLVQLDSYSRPRVPALTPVGFAQYLTTCILAHPDEEFRRLGKAVADVQLVADSLGGAEGPPERLPRQLLRSQFPVRHDPKSRKILEAALDDLMYDLRLVEPASPKTSLAIMPPPPSSERRGSGSAVGAGVRHYAPPEQMSARKDVYVLPAGPEVSKARGRYVPTGLLQTIGDETCTHTPAAETTDPQNRYRDARRHSYHDRPLSRYAEDAEIYEHAPARDRPRQNSIDLRPPVRFSSPRTSQTGSLTITPTTTTRTYRTTAYTPKSAGAGANTPTYRRAQSPPLRTYRASAPDVSGFKPAGYLPQASASSATADRRSSLSIAADRREYAASLVSAGAESYSRDGGSRELERRRGSAAGLVDVAPGRGMESAVGSKAATPVMTPSSTATALVPLPLSSALGAGSGLGHQHHSQQDSAAGRRTATAPPSPAPSVLVSSGEKKHHSHRRRRSAVVAIEDDRGPTWEEVLKAQPLSLHHHKSGSSSGKTGGGHHHRHHSGY